MLINLEQRRNVTLDERNGGRPGPLAMMHTRRNTPKTNQFPEGIPFIELISAHDILTTPMKVEKPINISRRYP